VRPTLLLLVGAVALLGCSLGLRPTATLPASFTDGYVQVGGMTFTAVDPPPGVASAAEVVAALRGRTRWGPFLNLPGVPFFGTLRCTGAMEGCQPGPAGFMGPARSVWVVIYPDWTGQDGDVGWIVVDARTGLAGGAIGNDPHDAGRVFLEVPVFNK
jgi:hypothetical protein